MKANEIAAYEIGENKINDSIFIGQFQNAENIREQEKNELKELAPELLKDSTVLQKVEKQQLEIAKTTENLRMKTKTPVYEKQFWLKEGYFVNTGADGSNIKIYLTKLNASENSGILFLTYNDQKIPFTLSEKSIPFSFEGTHYNYSVVYSTINYAGKNPFKKALYSTFQKYTKN